MVVFLVNASYHLLKNVEKSMLWKGCRCTENASTTHIQSRICAVDGLQRFSLTENLFN